MNQKATEKQIKALKYLVFKSKDAGPETKKACLALIDASQGLTKPVFFTGYSKDIYDGAHGIISGQGTTHLNQVMKVLGTEFVFSSHDGFFTAPGQFQSGSRIGEKHTRTLWLSSTECDSSASEISLDQVEAIELIDPLLE